jgi:hypothetical protein
LFDISVSPHPKLQLKFVGTFVTVPALQISITLSIEAIVNKI